MPSTRILMRAGRPPHDITSNEAAFAWRGSGHFGSNTGNMLFSDAVYQALNTPGTDITCDAYAPEWRTFTPDDAAYVNDNFDKYVIPLANAFRPGFAGAPLERLTALIRRLTIPVVVVGVGGQGPLSDHRSALSDDERRNTIDFVSAVLDHSSSIGVRGELTKAMLREMGFSDSDVDVIGCPSMFRTSRDFRVERKIPLLTRTAALATSLEAQRAHIGDLYSRNAREYEDLVAVYQTLAGGELILWGKHADALPAGTPRSISDAAYREGRMRFFTNSRTWLDFMRTRDFSFGVRIHGTVAAIAAGTPGFILTIDSRTQELAEYHAIPNMPLVEAAASDRLLARDLYDETDFESVNRAMPENWDRYFAFLERNGLEHIHQPGKDNPAYAQSIEDAPMPAGAAPLSTADPEVLAARIRWLWQDRTADHHRPTTGYRPSFELDHTSVTSAASLSKALRRELAKTQERLGALEARAERAERAAAAQPSQRARRAYRRLKSRLARLGRR